MEQLLCHLVGDYCLQSHDMATKKTTETKWAVYHGIMYTLPFITIASYKPLFVIAFTHVIIDRFRLATYVTKWKNYLFGGFNPQALQQLYPEATLPYLSVWLIILVDNSCHLLINYFAIKYL
jgi:hypothetical protein